MKFIICSVLSIGAYTNIYNNYNDKREVTTIWLSQERQPIVQCRFIADIQCEDTNYDNMSWASKVNIVNSSGAIQQ